ncbi:hypothetical protein TRVA0_022S01464 [Trichomonascus vanleenenianus]|uniref:uncharacterized protein n=1 Tax=Trichomonascus vanleenenianus TaxID=2268995 RepID=UPI003ECA674D
MTEVVSLPPYEFEPLPDYSSGVEVHDRVINSSPMKPLILKIDPPLKLLTGDGITVYAQQSESSGYRIGDIITGRLSVSLRADREAQFVTVELVMIESTISPSTCGSLRITRSVPVDSYTLPADSYPSHRNFQSQYTYEYPFTLTVPGELNTNSPVHEHRRLPPALGSVGGSHPSERDLSDLSARVGYAIRARFHTSIGVLHEATKYVSVVPYYPPPSSACLSSLVHEVSPVRDGLFKRRDSGAKLSATLARPLVVNVLQHAPMTVDLGVTLENCSSVDDPEVEVSVRIVSYTITSGKKLEYVPIPGDTDLRTHSEEISRQKLKTLLEQVAGGYSRRLKIPVAIPLDNPHLIPSFSTSMVTRAYRMHVSVQYCKTAVKLAVPVFVVQSDGLEPEDLDFYPSPRTSQDDDPPRSKFE